MGRKKSVRTAALLSATALLAVPAGLWGQDRLRLAGDEVAVHNLAGQVEVVSGSGPDVVVTVRRGGRDASGLRIESGRVAGREALRVLYPSDDVVYEAGGWNGRTDVRVRDDGTLGDGRRVRIRRSGEGLRAWADMRVEVPAGKRLRVYLAAGAIEAEGVEADLLLDTHVGPVRVTNVRGAVDVDTGSGSVTVADVTGEVTVDTGSGSVRVERIRGRHLFVDTGSGSVTGGSIEVSSLVVDTGSGRVELAAVSSSDVQVDTGSGSVELDLRQDVERLNVDTGSGGVLVFLPAGTGAEIELDTGSGAIDLDLPVEVRRMERNHLQGVLGDGRGSIVIDTGSGGIRIRGN